MSYWEFLCDKFDDCHNYIKPECTKLGAYQHELIFSAPGVSAYFIIDLTNIKNRIISCNGQIIKNGNAEYYKGDLVKDDYRAIMKRLLDTYFIK